MFICRLGGSDTEPISTPWLHGVSLVFLFAGDLKRSCPGMGQHFDSATRLSGCCQCASPLQAQILARPGPFHRIHHGRVLVRP
jgi:hypothetical protein